jgi:hypothetical protein
MENLTYISNKLQEYSAQSQFVNGCTLDANELNIIVNCADEAISTINQITNCEVKVIDVDPNKSSFQVGNTTYSLAIVDNKLFIQEYIPSSWGNVNIGQSQQNTSNPNKYSELEFDSTYTAMTLTAYPYTYVSYYINNPVNTSIALVGIKSKYGSNEYAYNYGSEVVINNGVIDNIEYVTTYISGQFDIYSNNGVPVEKTKESGNVVSEFTYTASCEEQSVILYYHEKGLSTLNSKILSSTSKISVQMPKPYKCYFLWYSTDLEDITLKGKSGKTSTPTSININATDGNYTFIAVSSPASFEIGGFVGGFKKVAENSDVYSDNTKYYIYRTDNTNIKGTVNLKY